MKIRHGRRLRRPGWVLGNRLMVGVSPCRCLCEADAVDVEEFWQTLVTRDSPEFEREAFPMWGVVSTSGVQILCGCLCRVPMALR